MTEQPRSRRRRILVILVVVIALLGAGLYVAFSSRPATTQPTTTTTTATTPPRTTTQTTTTTTATQTTTTTATTTPPTTTTQTTTTPTTTTTATITATTTTATTTTTPVPTETISGTAFQSVLDVLRSYGHAQMTFESRNGTEVDTTTATFDRREGDAVQGHQTYEVDLTIASPDGSTVSTLWIGKDDGVTYRARLEGQTFEYPDSQSLGGSLLGIFGIMFGLSGSLNAFDFQVAGGQVVGAPQGVTVDESRSTTWTVSGSTYPAWTIKVTNVGYAGAEFARAEFTLAQIRPDTWQYVQFKVTARDGLEFTWGLTELTAG